MRFARGVELGGAGVVVAAALLVWALAPTYPNYDSYYHLVWGRELLDGLTPTFEAYAAPMKTAAGKHALIEKPVASTAEDSRTLRDLFASKGLIGGVGHIERYNPAIGVFQRPRPWVAAYR